MLEFAGEDALVERIVSNPSEVVFLIGSGVVLSPSGEPGVPSVSEFVTLVREDLADSPKLVKQFDADLLRTDNPYQTAFAFLLHNRGQNAANRLVRRGVLAARRGGWKGRIPDITRCRELEHDLHGWLLPKGLQSLGFIISSYPDKFGRHILTTNFDPLIEISIQRAGGEIFRSSIASDGNIAHAEGQGCHVIHLHGDWLRSDTLHTGMQLNHNRPRLTSSLRGLLRDRTLAVVGYGGWDDVLTRAVAELLAETTSNTDVLWAFKQPNMAAIQAENPRILERLSDGISRGRVQLYCGIDSNSLFPTSLEKRLQMLSDIPSNGVAQVSLQEGRSAMPALARTSSPGMSEAMPADSGSYVHLLSRGVKQEVKVKGTDVTVSYHFRPAFSMPRDSAPAGSVASGDGPDPSQAQVLTGQDLNPQFSHATAEVSSHAAQHRAWLVVNECPDAKWLGLGLPLAESTTIGRAPESDFCLPFDKVSRHHATVERRLKGWVVFDAKSTNGTFCNGNRLTDVHALRDNDRLGLGEVVLTFLRELSYADLSHLFRELHRRRTIDPIGSAYTRDFANDLLRAMNDAHEPAVLLFVHVLGLESLNDARGTGAGDNLIRQILLAAADVVSNKHYIARHLGPRFVFILPGCSLEDLSTIQSGVASNVNRLLVPTENINVRFGVAQLRSDVGLDELAEQAFAPRSVSTP